MIYSLYGKVSLIDENTVVVNTGAMAFEVVCSTFTTYSLCASAEPQTILTYLQVKEDAMCLYGFSGRKEKLLFNNLLSVSGVGPKMAITVLSGIPLDDLVKAISGSDIKTLSAIKGLGKKTAERIVLELNGKFGGEGSLETILSGDNSSKANSVPLKKEMQEAIEVLVSTGLSKASASEIVKNNYVDGMTSEQLVVSCFKNLK